MKNAGQRGQVIVSSRGKSPAERQPHFVDRRSAIPEIAGVIATGVTLRVAQVDSSTVQPGEWEEAAM